MSAWIALTSAATLIMYVTYIGPEVFAPNPLGAMLAIDLTFAANAGALSFLAATRSHGNLTKAFFVTLTTLLLTPLIDFCLFSCLVQL